MIKATKPGKLKKLGQVQLLLKETQTNVLPMSETHLSNIDNDCELIIPGYIFVREDRQGCKNHCVDLLLK